MKRLIGLLLLLTLPVFANAGIVNNSGATGADSIPIVFVPLDSLGQMMQLGTDDSIGLVVYDPSGTVSYAGKVAYNDAAISSQLMFGTGNGTLPWYSYCWKLPVSVIDGASPSNGIYRYVGICKDSVLGEGAWGTPWMGEFQLYQTMDLNTLYDSVTASQTNIALPTKLFTPLMADYDNVSGSIGEYIQIAGDSSLWADIDSVLIGEGLKVNAFSKTIYGADRDTLKIGYGSAPDETILQKRIYYHIGGRPGGRPDSTRVITGP